MNDNDEQNNSNEKRNPLNNAQKRRKPYTRMIDISDQFMYETFEMGADLSGEEKQIAPQDLPARPEEQPEMTGSNSGLGALLGSGEHDKAEEPAENPQATTFSSLMQATGEFQKPKNVEKPSPLPVLPKYVPRQKPAKSASQGVPEPAPLPAAPPPPAFGLPRAGAPQPPGAGFAAPEPPTLLQPGQSNQGMPAQPHAPANPFQSNQVIPAQPPAPSPPPAPAPPNSGRPPAPIQKPVGITPPVPPTAAPTQRSEAPSPGPIQQAAPVPPPLNSVPLMQVPDMNTDLDDLIFNNQNPEEPPTSYRTEMSARHKTVRRADFTRPRIPQLDPKDSDVVASSSPVSDVRPRSKRSFFQRLKDFFAQVGSASRKLFKDD